MKRKVLTVIFVGILSTVQAQVKIGIQAGFLASKSTITADTEPTTWELDKFSGKSKLTNGYKFGAFFEIPVSSNFYFSPELNYVHKGAEFSGERPFSTPSYSPNAVIYSRTIATNYLEVPFNVVYKAGEKSGRFLFGLGPVIGLGLSGKHIYDVHRQETTSTSVAPYSGNKDIKFDGKEEADLNYSHFNLIELGANVNAGYELKNGLRFGLQYRPNFNDLNPQKSATYRNNYFAFNLGYAL